MQYWYAYPFILFFILRLNSTFAKHIHGQEDTPNTNLRKLINIIIKTIIHESFNSRCMQYPIGVVLAIIVQIINHPH